MMRLTRTGIGLLTAQYRSVLRKCALINAGLFLALAPSVAEACSMGDPNCISMILSWGGKWIVSGTFHGAGSGNDLFFNYKPDESKIPTKFMCLEAGCGYYGSWQNVYEYGPYQEGDEGYGVSYSNYEAFLNSMSEADKAAALKYDAKYAVLDSNGAYVRATYSVAENIKALDTQVATNTSTIAAHTAVINALDNNYYRNIEVSRAEKYKKSPLAERSECIQGSTGFFKKFEDALTIAAQSRHDGLIFVANDNTVTTTGNTTMYKKEA